MSEFLIEIHSEEIPARFQEPAAKYLKELICKKLEELKLKYANANFFVSPRRLIVVIESIQLNQDDVLEERKGPGVDAPEAAVQGFLKSVGKTINEIERKKLKKGTVPLSLQVVAQQHDHGRHVVVAAALHRLEDQPLGEHVGRLRRVLPGRGATRVSLWTELRGTMFVAARAARSRQPQRL